MSDGTGDDGCVVILGVGDGLLSCVHRSKFSILATSIPFFMAETRNKGRKVNICNDAGDYGSPVTSAPMQ